MSLRSAIAGPRRPRKLIGTVSVAVLALSALNCFKDPLTPVPPSWDVNLTFPVAVKDVSMSDLIEKDSSTVTSDASHRIVFSSVVKATPVSIGDQLSFMPSAAKAFIQLGSFAVTLNPITESVSPQSITPGSNTPVPAGTLSFPSIQSATGLSGGVTFKSGTIGLTLKNNMPIVITPVQPILLLDGQGATIARFDFGGQAITPAHSLTSYSDLTGAKFGGNVSVSGLSFSTPGSQPWVTFPDDSMLVATINFNNAMASAAELASVPAQRLIDNDRTSVQLDDSTMVEVIGMKSGLLRFTFQNHIGVGVQFKFRLENLFKQMGGLQKQYEDSLYLGAKESGVYSMDLTNCEFQAAPGQLLNTLELTSSVVIPTAVNQAVAIHDTDRVDIAMNPATPIVVDTVSGALKPTWVSINTAVGISKGTFPSKFKGQFVIPSASLSFHAVSGVGYPADLYLNLSATRPDGQIASLAIPASQRRVLPGGTTITFDQASVGTFLSQFSSGLPDSLHITGKVLVNPPDCYTTDPLKAGGLSSACVFGGTVSLSIPLTIGITQATYRDTVAFGLAEDGSNKKPGEDQLKNVNTAKLHVELQNGLPADVKIRVHILDALHHEILTIPQAGGFLSVGAAGVDAQGYSTTPGGSTIEIALNHAEALQYSPATYVDYEVSMASAQGGSTVTFRTSDAIHVRVWTECSMGVNK